MRQPAGVLSSEEIARLKHEAEAELEGQRAVAQARKEKMLKVCHAAVLLPLQKAPCSTVCAVMFYHNSMLELDDALSSQSCFPVLTFIHFSALIC